MHFFVQLCGLNNQSENAKVFSAFKSPIKTFDNIFRNISFRITTVLLKFQNFAFKPEVCKMGGSVRLKNGLNLLYMIWPSDQRLNRRMLWSQLDALYDFQSMCIVRFRKL